MSLIHTKKTDKQDGNKGMDLASLKFPIWKCQTSSTWNINTFIDSTRKQIIDHEVGPNLHFTLLSSNLTAPQIDEQIWASKTILNIRYIFLF